MAAASGCGKELRDGRSTGDCNGSSGSAACKLWSNGSGDGDSGGPDDGSYSDSMRAVAVEAQDPAPQVKGGEKR